MTDYDKQKTEEVQEMLRNLGLGPLELEDIKDQPVENIRVRDIFRNCDDISSGDSIVKSITFSEPIEDYFVIVAVFWDEYEKREHKLALQIPQYVIIVAKEQKIFSDSSV